MVGINYDAATYVTAQQTAPATAERTVTVDLRPDTVIRARISGTTATGGALSTAVVTTAQTDGLSVVASATNFSSPDMDEGCIFGYSGVNAGQLRKITTSADGTATVTVAFENDSAVGDLYTYFPFYHLDVAADTVTLTTELDEVRANVAGSAAAAELQPIYLELGTLADEGTTKSYVHLVPNNHLLSQSSG